MTGPLEGIRVLEFSGIGPAPYAAMLLADLGADMICIDRESGGNWPRLPIVSRGRPVLNLDLKTLSGIETCFTAISAADILIEGFRPGVMERLGLGPEAAMARNPRLIYGRVTGWGQAGPLSKVAGHDINYLAVSGSLAPLGGREDIPTPPLNMLGDYAAGSLFLVMGVLAALAERARTKRGQIVDAAIVDGAASLMAPLLGMQLAGLLTLDPAGNMLGGRYAPFYRSYRCADGKCVAIGPLEPRFRDALFDAIGFRSERRNDLDNPRNWPAAIAELESIFLQRTRDEWADRFETEEMCLSPVLTPDEAVQHRHMRERGCYDSSQATITPGRAPRFQMPVQDVANRYGDESAATKLSRWGLVTGQQ